MALDPSGNGRTYCPTTMQFVSPDPFIQSPQSSANYNRYSYCMNNPIMYSDPSGYQYYPYQNEVNAINKAQLERWLSTGAPGGGGGGGSIFPKYGVLGSPRNNLEYEKQLAYNLDTREGGSFFTDGLNQRISTFGEVSYIETSKLRRENVQVLDYTLKNGELYLKGTKFFNIYVPSKLTALNPNNANRIAELFRKYNAGSQGGNSFDDWIDRSKDQHLMDLDFKYLRGYGAKGKVEVFGQKVMLGVHLATIEHSYNVVTGYKKTGYSGIELGLGPVELGALYDYNTGFDFKFGLSAAKFSTVSDPKMNVIGVSGYFGVGGSVGLDMNVGKYLNTVAPVYEHIYKSGGFTMGTFSDGNLKEDISPIDSSLNKVSRLNGYKYVWSSDAPEGLKGNDIGVLAQEVEIIFPEAVQIDERTGYKKVYYYKLIPVLIEALKEQQVIIENQNVLINEYEGRVKSNEEKLERVLKRLTDLEGNSSK
ncbi:tail fiber domain-containing protein [Saccharicrinis sp. GN24d3]|uniref:tail fiber domain-containing protein n=1 Tax=Saccharicrinis sp. GN24d3 TaxID=3458416 RepID=UPI00403659A1